MKGSKVRLILIFSVVLLLCFSSASIGYVYGSSNLGVAGYPEFRSMRPIRPVTNSKVFINKYKEDVDQYLRDARKYIESAQNDRTLIKEAVEQCTRDATSVIDEYNTWLNYGY